MIPKTSAERAFANALRSFQTGGITYNGLLAEVRMHLAAGAPASALLEALARREIVEPLPGYVHDAVVNLLQQSGAKAGENSRHAAAAPLHPSVASPQAPPAAPPQPPRAAPPPQPPAERVAPRHSLTAEKTPPVIDVQAAPEEDITIVLDEAESELDEATAKVAPADHHRRVVTAGDILLGRFHLLSLVGEGGMSRVYRATDSQPAREYSSESFIAVKVLTRHFNEDFESFPALQAEVQNLHRLTHPNIVRMYGCERDGSIVFITMEYLAGESIYTRLRARLRAGNPRPGFDRDEAQAIIITIAGALDYAHLKGVVHGDLKPGNVIVTDKRDVKIIDFGIATWIGRPKTAFERPGTSRGTTASAVTPRYASPQLMARQKPEPVDDVYSLACLAYELLTGAHPFDGGTAAQPGFSPPHRSELTTSQYKALLHGLQSDRQQRTPTVRKFMEEFAPPALPNVWRNRAIWAAVAAIGLGVGWFYGGWFHGPPSRKSGTPSPPAGTQVAPAPSLPVPAPSVQTTAKPGTVLRDCAKCPLMVVLPTGRFKQGSPQDAAGSSPLEQPQHEVVIDHPFAVSANDVTVGDFREFAAATKRAMSGCDTYDGEWRHRPSAGWKHPGFTQSALHPVTCVSWNDAAAYALWLSAKTAHRYRLPSASEWEYAARGGGEAVQPWDSGGLGACANANVADQSAARRYPGWSVFGCDDGYVHTAPVGSFEANTFGLKDMLGNVVQWTQDCWHTNYVGAPTDGSARSDGDCAQRELRGGTWFSSPSYVRASYRNHFGADYRASSVGFRLVREIPP